MILNFYYSSESTIISRILLSLLNVFIISLLFVASATSPISAQQQNQLPQKIWLEINQTFAQSITIDSSSIKRFFPGEDQFSIADKIMVISGYLPPYFILKISDIQVRKLLVSAYIFPGVSIEIARVRIKRVLEPEMIVQYSESDLIGGIVVSFGSGYIGTFAPVWGSAVQDPFLMYNQTLIGTTNEFMSFCFDEANIFSTAQRTSFQKNQNPNSNNGNNIKISIHDCSVDNTFYYINDRPKQSVFMPESPSLIRVYAAAICGISAEQGYPNFSPVTSSSSSSSPTPKTTQNSYLELSIFNNILALQELALPIRASHRSGIILFESAESLSPLFYSNFFKSTILNSPNTNPEGYDERLLTFSSEFAKNFSLVPYFLVNISSIQIYNNTITISTPTALTSTMKVSPVAADPFGQAIQGIAIGGEIFNSSLSGKIDLFDLVSEYTITTSSNSNSNSNNNDLSQNSNMFPARNLIQLLDNKITLRSFWSVFGIRSTSLGAADFARTSKNPMRVDFYRNQIRVCGAKMLAGIFLHSCQSAKYPVFDFRDNDLFVESNGNSLVMDYYREASDTVNARETNSDGGGVEFGSQRLDGIWITSPARDYLPVEEYYRNFYLYSSQQPYASDSQDQDNNTLFLDLHHPDMFDLSWPSFYFARNKIVCHILSAPKLFSVWYAVAIEFKTMNTQEVIFYDWNEIRIKNFYFVDDRDYQESYLKQNDPSLLPPPRKFDYFTAVPLMKLVCWHIKFLSQDWTVNSTVESLASIATRKENFVSWYGSRNIMEGLILENVTFENSLNLSPRALNILKTQQSESSVANVSSSGTSLDFISVNISSTTYKKWLSNKNNDNLPNFQTDFPNRQFITASSSSASSDSQLISIFDFVYRQQYLLNSYVGIHAQNITAEFSGLDTQEILHISGANFTTITLNRAFANFVSGGTNILVSEKGTGESFNFLYNRAEKVEMYNVVAKSTKHPVLSDMANSSSPFVGIGMKHLRVEVLRAENNTFDIFNMGAARSFMNHRAVDSYFARNNIRSVVWTDNSFVIIQAYRDMEGVDTSAFYFVAKSLVLDSNTVELVSNGTINFMMITSEGDGLGDKIDQGEKNKLNISDLLATAAAGNGNNKNNSLKFQLPLRVSMRHNHVTTNILFDGSLLRANLKIPVLVRSLPSFILKQTATASVFFFSAIKIIGIALDGDSLTGTSFMFGGDVIMDFFEISGPKNIMTATTTTMTTFASRDNELLLPACPTFNQFEIVDEGVSRKVASVSLTPAKLKYLLNEGQNLPVNPFILQLMRASLAGLGVFNVSVYNGSCHPEVLSSKTRSRFLEVSQSRSENKNNNKNNNQTRHNSTKSFPLLKEQMEELLLSDVLNQEDQISESDVGAKPSSTLIGISSAISFLVAEPTTSLEAGRSLAMIGIVSRCQTYLELQTILEHQFQELAKKHNRNGAAFPAMSESEKIAMRNSLRDRFVFKFMVRSTIKFPDSLFPGFCLEDHDNNNNYGGCIAGAVLSGMIVILIFSCLSIFGFGFIQARKFLKAGQNGQDNCLRKAKLENGRHEKNRDSGEETREESLTLSLLIRFSRIPYVFCQSIAFQQGMWLFNAFCILVAPKLIMTFFNEDDSSSSTSYKISGVFLFFFGILPIFFIWFVPFVALVVYIQHSSLSRSSFENNKSRKSKQQKNQQRLFSCFQTNNDPMRRSEAFQVENVFLEFPKFSSANNKKSTSSSSSLFASKVKNWFQTKENTVMNMPNKSFENNNDDQNRNIKHFLNSPNQTKKLKKIEEASSTITSRIMRFLFLPEYVWSQGNTSRSAAKGANGEFLWSLGPLVTAYHGPHLDNKRLQKQEMDELFIHSSQKQKIQSRKNGAPMTSFHFFSLANENNKNSNNMKRDPGKTGFFLPSSAASSQDASALNRIRARIAPFSVFVASFWTAVSCLAQAIAALYPDQCQSMMTLMSVAGFVTCLVALVIRPSLVRFRNYLAILGEFVAFLGCVLATISFSVAKKALLFPATSSSSSSSISGLTGSAQILLLISVVVAIVGSLCQGVLRVFLAFDLVQIFTFSQVVSNRITPQNHQNRNHNNEDDDEVLIVSGENRFSSSWPSSKKINRRSSRDDYHNEGQDREMTERRRRTKRDDQSHDRHRQRYDENYYYHSPSTSSPTKLRNLSSENHQHASSDDDLLGMRLLPPASKSRNNATSHSSSRETKREHSRSSQNKENELRKDRRHGSSNSRSAPTDGSRHESRQSSSKSRSNHFQDERFLSHHSARTRDSQDPEKHSPSAQKKSSHTNRNRDEH